MGCEHFYRRDRCHSEIFKWSCITFDEYSQIEEVLIIADNK